MKKLTTLLAAISLLLACGLCFGQQMSQSEMRKAVDEFKTSLLLPPNYSKTLTFPNKSKAVLIKAAEDAIDDNLITRIKTNDSDGFAVKAMSLAIVDDIQTVAVKVTAKDGAIKIDLWKFSESWNSVDKAKDILDSIISSLNFALN